jgi:hypothetical protein
MAQKHKVYEDAAKTLFVELIDFADIQPGDIFVEVGDDDTDETIAEQIAAPPVEGDEAAVISFGDNFFGSAVSVALLAPTAEEISIIGSRKLLRFVTEYKA